MGAKYKHFIDGIPAYKVAEQNGIKKHTFHIRVCQLGYSVERAATEPVKPARFVSDWEYYLFRIGSQQHEKVFSSCEQVADFLGVNKRSVEHLKRKHRKKGTKNFIIGDYIIQPVKR